MSNYLQRLEPLSWSPYFDECLQILQETKECPNDELLVCLIRVQLISNKVSTISWNDTFPVGDGGKQFPREFYTHALRSQLEEVERSLPSVLKGNGEQARTIFISAF